MKAREFLNYLKGGSNKSSLSFDVSGKDIRVCNLFDRLINKQKPKWERGTEQTKLKLNQTKTFMT